MEQILIVEDDSFLNKMLDYKDVYKRQEQSGFAAYSPQMRQQQGLHRQPL